MACTNETSKGVAEKLRCDPVVKEMTLAGKSLQEIADAIGKSKAWVVMSRKRQGLNRQYELKPKDKRTYVRRNADGSSPICHDECCQPPIGENCPYADECMKPTDQCVKNNIARIDYYLNMKDGVKPVVPDENGFVPFYNTVRNNKCAGHWKGF